MSNVLKAMRLDYFILKANYRTFLFIYLLAILLAVFTQPTLAIVIVMVFSVFFSGVVFSLYEKNNLSKLYGILPLGRFEIVIGRYLYALFFGITNGIVSGSLAYIISLFTNKGMNRITLITYLSATFLYFCLSIGISFPIYFKFGFSKAYIFTMLPLYLVFISCVFISRKTNALNNTKQIIQYFISHQNMILVTGIGLGLILLAISCPLSYLINKKSEL